MIKVNYECDETGQQMEIYVAGVDSNQAEVSIKFIPEISDDSKDPFGIIGMIFKAVTPSHPANKK